jgi:hypothetical protein
MNTMGKNGKSYQLSAISYQSLNRAALRVCGLALLVAVPPALVGCGGDGGAGGGAAADVEPVEIQNPGTITGVVNFAGEAPMPEPIDMRSEPACAERHEGTPVQHTVLVNDNGTLRNVFVRVSEGIDQRFPAPRDPVELDQVGCVYTPHIVAVQAGQPIAIRNSDPVLHNVNTRPQTNRGFNISQPQAGMVTERTFNSQEVMIPVRCDVHGWMAAYIGVVDHPYFAVTGDDGSFRIENLPPGDYVIEAWHEQYGTQTANVTVPPDGTAEADFNYSPGTATAVPLGEPWIINGQGASSHAGHGAD